MRTTDGGALAFIEESPQTLLDKHPRYLYPDAATNYSGVLLPCDARCDEPEVHHHLYGYDTTKSAAWNAWEKENLEWIECLAPKVLECSEERHLVLYRLWLSSHPRPAR